MTTPTPRTDAAEIIRDRINPGVEGFELIVASHFARQLETELVAAEAEIGALRDQIHENCDTITKLKEGK